MADYLEIQSGQHKMLLPMSSTQEVLNISASLMVPVANMPSSVLGLFNRHSRVYWLLDLGQILGLVALGNLPKYAVTILSVEDQVMAIASEMLNGIHKLATPITSKTTDTPPHLAPYVDGYIDEWMVLNPQALLKSVS